MTDEELKRLKEQVSTEYERCRAEQESKDDDSSAFKYQRRLKR